jgi:hypothetical protein
MTLKSFPCNFSVLASQTACISSTHFLTETLGFPCHDLTTFPSGATKSISEKIPFSFYFLASASLRLICSFEQVLLFFLGKSAFIRIRFLLAKSVKTSDSKNSCRRPIQDIHQSEPEKCNRINSFFSFANSLPQSKLGSR